MWLIFFIYFEELSLVYLMQICLCTQFILFSLKKSILSRFIFKTACNFLCLRLIFSAQPKREIMRRSAHV